jgi:murein DD-endopeptidase MepM/ murein hydrolase activator NlpD
MKRAVLSSMVTATVLAGLIMSPVVSYASQLTIEQQKAAQLAQQKKATESKINQLKTQEQSLSGQLSQIQALVQNLDSSIIKTQADIVQRNNRIASLQQEISKTQKEIDSQYIILEQRIRVMYEDGHSSYLDVLLSATSFSDFLDRLQLLAQIAAQDKKVLTNIETNKHHLDAEKGQVQQQLAEVRKSYNLLLTQKTQEQNQQRAEQTLLQKVHSTRLSQQAALKSENAAMQNLQTLIKQLEAEVGSYTGASDGWTWPVPGHFAISSPYGWRTWSDGTREFHNGIDIPASIGTPMVAATGGKVLYAGPASGFGDWIVIQSAGGLLEIYGHMYAYEIKVHPGEIVHKGQQIAAVGSNGFSTGPHLHFTVATGFDAAGFPISVNPTKYVGG